MTDPSAYRAVDEAVSGIGKGRSSVEVVAVAVQDEGSVEIK